MAFVSRNPPRMGLPPRPKLIPGRGLRLLQCEKANNYSLTVELDEDLAPPYAILSHTWEQGQEVILTDLQSRIRTGKKGFEKLRFCRKQVEREREPLHYFWVDTCCIDKTNPAEVERSINSMFRWYSKAKLCYVYLSDVFAPSDENGDASPTQDWMQQFRKSRWFTRGWTLQELLAPANVHFFSAEGALLGDKKSLSRELYSITGIPVKALSGQTPLSRFSIDQRLKWVISRYTTEKEDLAYSLMGIFDVSMFTRYGEGDSHAFKRLLKEAGAPTEPRDMAKLEKLGLINRRAQLEHVIASEDVSEEPPFTSLSKFATGDEVHLSVTRDGRRMKAQAEICDSRYNSSRDCFEYELMFLDETPYLVGGWVPEKELRVSRKTCINHVHAAH